MIQVNLLLVVQYHSQFDKVTEVYHDPPIFLEQRKVKGELKNLEKVLLCLRKHSKFLYLSAQAKYRYQLFFGGTSPTSFEVILD